MEKPVQPNAAAPGQQAGEQELGDIGVAEHHAAPVGEGTCSLGGTIASIGAGGQKRHARVTLEDQRGCEGELLATAPDAVAVKRDRGLAPREQHQWTW